MYSVNFDDKILRWHIYFAFLIDNRIPRQDPHCDLWWRRNMTLNFKYFLHPSILGTWLVNIEVIFQNDRNYLFNDEENMEKRYQ